MLISSPQWPGYRPGGDEQAVDSGIVHTWRSFLVTCYNLRIAFSVSPEETLVKLWLNRICLLTLVLLLGTISVPGLAVAGPSTENAGDIAPFTLATNPPPSTAPRPERVRYGVELTLSGDYPQAIEWFDSLIAAEPEHPSGYLFKSAAYLHWLQRDPENEDLADKFLALLDESVTRAEAMQRQQQRSAEALFYIGGARGLRAQLMLVKRRYFKAVGDAKAGKKALDMAQEIDPNFNDVYFGLGTYNFYIDALPKVIGLLKHILRVQDGDREKGIEQLWRAVELGEVAGPPSLYLLWDIYWRHEKRLDEAFAVGNRLHARYPRNAWIAYWLGQMTEESVRDCAAAADRYREAIAIAKGRAPDRTSIAARAAGHAEVRLARVLTAELQLTEALSGIETFMATNPTEPPGIRSAGQLEIARIRGLLGQREAAVALLRDVLRAPDVNFGRTSSLGLDGQDGELHKQAKLAIKEIENLNAGAFELAVRGWGLIRREGFSEALDTFERALKSGGAKSVIVQYGLGVCRHRLGQAEPALAALRTAAKADALADHEWMRAEALLLAGQIYDARRDRTAALAAYGAVGASRAARESTRQSAERFMQEPFAPRTGDSASSGRQ